MTSASQKTRPREFWIQGGRFSNKPDAVWESPVDGYIHVIEHSALLAKDSEIQLLKSSMAELEGLYEATCEIEDAQEKQIAELKQKNEILISTNASRFEMIKGLQDQLRESLNLNNELLESKIAVEKQLKSAREVIEFNKKNWEAQSRIPDQFVAWKRCRDYLAKEGRHE